MKTTRHLEQRMNQRGITRSMLETVLEFGTVCQKDRYTLDAKEARASILCIQRHLSELKKIADKGGVTVVVKGDTLVTTWNMKGGQCWQRDRVCTQSVRPGRC